jgi:hypothetical protein
VQTETRQVHVSDCPGCIEPRQNVAQLADMLGNNPTLIVVFMKAFSPLWRIDRTILSVMRYVTDVYRLRLTRAEDITPSNHGHNFHWLARARL